MVIIMTVQEAIKRIKDHNEIHSKNEHFAIHITEALNMAIEALEMRTLKEPDFYMIQRDVSYKCQCPNCKRTIKQDYFFSLL